jgi:hypothetical protein
MWQTVTTLIRRSFWRRFGHKKDSVKRDSESPYGRQISDQMRNNDMVGKYPAGGRLGDLAGACEGDFADSIDVSVEERALKINEGGVCASDPGNFAGCAWNSLHYRRNCGFLGHDGVPWLWEAEKQCWLPVTKSSRATDYAALQARTRPV